MKLNPPAIRSRSFLFLALITLSLLHGAQSDGVEAALTDIGSSAGSEAVTGYSNTKDSQSSCDSGTCHQQAIPEVITVASGGDEHVTSVQQQNDEVADFADHDAKPTHQSDEQQPSLHIASSKAEAQQLLYISSEAEHLGATLKTVEVGNDDAAVEKSEASASQGNGTSGTVDTAVGSPSEQSSNGTVIQPDVAIPLQQVVQPPTESIQPKEQPVSEPVKTETNSNTETAVPEEPASEAADRLINLAAAADGASVVAANKEARKPEKTIDGDHDSYMKNHCPAHKWIIIELSQLGRVDEVQLVNKEMYSSRVRDFSIRGRQSHPRKDGPQSDWPRFFNADSSWQFLGNYTAQNKKGEQTFKMQQPLRVRYLLLQFHTHYGVEEMCALNSISVMGITAAQELEEALSRHIAPPAVTERLSNQKPPVTESPRTTAPAVQVGVDTKPTAKNVSKQATAPDTDDNQQSNQEPAAQPVKPEKSVPDKPITKHPDHDDITADNTDGSGVGQPQQKTDGGDYNATGLVTETPQQKDMTVQSSIITQTPQTSEPPDQKPDASSSNLQDSLPDGDQQPNQDSEMPDIVDSHYLPEPWLNYEYTDGETIAELESHLTSTTEANDDTKSSQETDQAEIVTEHDVPEHYTSLPVPVNTAAVSSETDIADQKHECSGLGMKQPAHSMSDIPQSKIVLLPPPEPTSTLLIDSPLLAAMEGGPAAKPKQAGNLFDIFKQEFVFLRLNQTHVWQYITTIVDVLNKNAAAMAEEIASLKKQLGIQREQQSVTDSTQAGQVVLTEITEFYLSHIDELREEMTALRKQVEQARQREVALLMYISTALSLMFGFLALRQGSEKGQAVLDSLFPRLVMLVGIVNGFIGVALQNPSLQQFLLAFIRQHLGLLSQSIHQSSTSSNQ